MSFINSALLTPATDVKFITWSNSKTSPYKAQNLRFIKSDQQVILAKWQQSKEHKAYPRLPGPPYFLERWKPGHGNVRKREGAQGKKPTTSMRSMCILMGKTWQAAHGTSPRALRPAGRARRGTAGTGRPGLRGTRSPSAGSGLQGRSGNPTDTARSPAQNTNTVRQHDGTS